VGEQTPHEPEGIPYEHITKMLLSTADCIGLCISGIWGLCPRPSPGLCPWTPQGDFRPQTSCANHISKAVYVNVYMGYINFVVSSFTSMNRASRCEIVL